MLILLNIWGFQISSVNMCDIVTFSSYELFLT